MTSINHTSALDYAAMPDHELVACVQHGDAQAFRQIMQRCNQRLFRIARGVVNDDAEAEDVVQEAYVHAYESLAAFRGESQLLTWLTRIVLNEAYGRLRQRRPTVAIEHLDIAQADSGRVIPFPSKYGSEDPAAAAARAQLRGLLETAVAELPEAFRIVFVMREIEQCSVEETAAALGLRQETVKTRLHRARRLLRTNLHDTVLSTLNEAFPFLGVRCERLTRNVLLRLDAHLQLQQGD
jgi:RNA polymerase sigma-70 factor (ECF subfamily)